MISVDFFGERKATDKKRRKFTVSILCRLWEDRGYTRSGIIEPGYTLDVNTDTRRPIAGGEVTEF